MVAQNRGEDPYWIGSFLFESLRDARFVERGSQNLFRDLHVHGEFFDMKGMPDSAGTVINQMREFIRQYFEPYWLPKSLQGYPVHWSVTSPPNRIFPVNLMETYACRPREYANEPYENVRWHAIGELPPPQPSPVYEWNESRPWVQTVRRTKIFRGSRPASKEYWKNLDPKMRAERIKKFREGREKIDQSKLMKDKWATAEYRQKVIAAQRQARRPHLHKTKGTNPNQLRLFE
jgi:hypothetical protein